MSQKQIIKINASSLPYSKCILQWHRTIIQGYKGAVNPAAVVYGVAVHAFVNAMYKTDGRLDIARDAALRAFRVPKFTTARYQDHLLDENHLIVVCYNLWNDWIAKQIDFDVLMLRSKCFWCDGQGAFEPPDGTGGGFGPKCDKCNGSGFREQPATELTFSLPYYEDEDFIVNLEGTLDRLGKFKNGCFCYRDWKTTSSRDEDYLADYEMHGQLKFYLLAVKLMSKYAPDSILGQVGKTRVGACIDGIFLKKAIHEVEYETSDVFQFSEQTMAEYQELLDCKIQDLLFAIRSGRWRLREGMLNGACQQRYSKCNFWHVCKAQDEAIQQVLLKRDFVQKEYDPLHHND